MPLLSFDVYSNYEEVTRLRQEITMLENRLKSFGPGTSITTIRAVETQLSSARSQFRALTMDAARAGADLELNIRKGINGAIAALNDLQNKLTDPIQGLTQIAGVAGLGMFLNQIKNIRGEFQQMESSINTLVGEAKGAELMEQLTEFAKVSPLDFKGTVSGAQMMLGFGIDADKVPRYLSAIGDVSMGNAQRFQSLTLAFSQMSAAGKLMGQDLNQMINAGFNPLQTMAEKTGKSIAALKNEMSQGKISAEMVQQAFVDATSSGGKYYQMSEKASQTIGGQMSMLQDATDLMFNDLGKKSEGMIIKVIEGATKLIENYEKIGPVLGKAVIAFGIYKASAMASDFAVRKQAEDSTKAIVEGFNEQIAKLEELKNAKKIDALDTDIKDAVNTGAISQDKGERIQKLRDEIRLEEEVASKAKEAAEAQVEEAKKALQSADSSVDAAHKKVDAANAHYETALNSLDLQEIAQARSEQESAMLELTTAERERNAAATRLQSAETAANTAETQLNAASERANAAAQIQNTSATNANTAAQNENTAAVTRGRVATAFASAGQKIATVTTHLWTSATVAAKKAWDGLKVAMATNPFGIILTAAASLWAIFSSFSDEVEETSAEIDRFGESAVKTKNNVDTLFAVLASTSSNSKVYKDALSELEKVAKDYGIVLNDESDKYEQLITQREKLIKLIEEEGRQRQIANQTAAFQKDQQDATDDFITKMSESIKDESRGDAKDQADKFARIIASTVDEKKAELQVFVDQLNQLEKERKETAVYDAHTGQAIYDPKFDSQIAETQKAIAQMANSSAKKFAEELGIGDKYILDIKDTCGFVTQYMNTSATNAKFLSEYTRQAKENQEALAAEKIEQPFDPKSFQDIEALFKDYDARIQKINDTDIKPKADTEQIDKVKDSASEAKDEVDNLDATTAEPSAKTKQIDNVTESATEASSAVDVLGAKKVDPVVKSTWLNKFTENINKAWVGLQKLVGVENPEPLIKDGKTTSADTTSKQEKENLTSSVHEDIARRIKEAKTSEDFDLIRKALNSRLKKTDQSSAEYKWLEKQIKALDKRDKTKNKSKDDPKQKAWEIAEAQRQEDERIAAERLKEQQRQEELRIAQIEDDAEKEIEQIKFNAEKKRQTLIDERKKEAERLKNFDRQQWLKSGKERKAYQWKQTKSDEEYLAEAGRNVGYDTQSAKIATDTSKELDKNYRDNLASMRDFLKQYGTFQQKKLAIAQEYADKIQKAQSEGERLALQAQEKSDLQAVEQSAVISQIDWYSVFDNVGVVLKGQLEPLYQQLKDYVKTDDFIRSGADNQAKVIDAMENLRQQLGDNQSWQDLASAMSGYQNALAELRTAMENDAKVTEEMGRLMAIQTQAQSELIAANAKLAEVNNDPNHSDTDLQAANEAVIQATSALETASQAVSNYGTTVNQSSIELQTAQNSVKSFGTMLSQTAKNVIKPISKMTTFFSSAGLSQLAELWGAFDSLKGAIDGLKGLSAFKEASDAIDNLKTAATEGAEAFEEALSNSPQVIQDAMTKLGMGFQDFSESASDAADKLGKEVSDATQSASDAVLEGSRQGVDALAKGLGKSGLIAGIIASILKILDVLADGVGPLISSILDSILNAISGIIGNILNFKNGLFRQIGESLYKGILGIFKSIFTLGGLFDWWGSGESDKNLEKDIERLTNTNEALRKAVDNLAEKMQDSAVADASDIYAVQKSNIEQSMKNTQEMMSRAGAAYSNGFLGIGGHKSSNNKINKAMSSTEWARISKIVGKTVNSASDFWNLTSEQMAKIAQDAPDLYGKIKQYADDGHKDAAQFMDEYIEYYKELEELKNAYRERLTDVSLDSVKDEFMSMLLDMESSTKDFTESFEKMMQQAVINSLMSSKYNDLIKKWYENFAKAMEGDDATITAEEQKRLKEEWDSIVSSAVADRDKIKSAMGWDSDSYSQEASRGSWQTMSQDTGTEISGRLTAIQIAVESIRANGESEYLSIAELNNELIQIMQQYSLFNVHYENIERQLAKIYVEVLAISENTGAIVKPIQTMQEDIAEIKRNTKNL